MVREGTTGLTHEAAKVADLLTGLGVDNRQARVVAYLARNETADGPRIQRALRLRQPEVSIATKQLRDRGWLAEPERKGTGRGRPVHVYRLGRPFPEIVESVADEKRREVEGELEKIGRLRKLLG